MPSNTAEKFVLHGHVVTMNGAFETIEKGAVYVSGNTIVAVQAAPAPAPASFENAPVVDTKGTIYPGLIELHNHLSYDALPLWKVPAKYSNRDPWPAHPQYHQLVTGPMALLGKSKRADLLAALVRYVETKCLVGGVTTSQGVALSSNAGIRTYYKGVVRNVEQPLDAALPAARTHIADVEAREWQQFFKAISGSAVVILHLSEGKDDKARQHFLALENGNKWAITDRLIGIHCAALQAQDFAVMAQHGGSMVWSPFSNYLLYGDTADVAAARTAGVAIALGSDWSPSGSKSLLGELKIAQTVASEENLGLGDRDVVAMATTNPAKMLKWDKATGSLEPGKRADCLVIGKQNTDPYGTLIKAHEDDVTLVVIDGVARYGQPSFMTALDATFDTIDVAGERRGVRYHDPSANPDIDALALSKAVATLRTFFGGLPNPPPPIAPAGVGAPQLSKVELVLDELEPGTSQRPLLSYAGHRTGWQPAAMFVAAKAAPLPLVPIDVDPLTVKDDETFLDTCKAEGNLPDWLKVGLTKAF